MTKEITRAIALFNWMSFKQMDDKKIGELSIADILEMVKFLSDGGSDARN